MGVVLKQLDLHEQAIGRFERYSNSFRRDPIPVFFMGESYLALEDYYSALQNFNKALSLNPSDYRSQYYIGNCYYLLEDFQNAAVALKKALEINPDDPDTHYLLGLTYLKLEKLRSARNELNILYMLEPVLYDSLESYINKH